MNKEVAKYIEKQEVSQREILKILRKLILKTIPKCSEEMKWGVPTFAGGKFYIVALKDKVNVGFAITGLSKEEVGFFEGTGKTMRHIKIRSIQDIDEKELKKLMKLVNKKAKCLC
jgi:hypothetical protein